MPKNNEITTNNELRKDLIRAYEMLRDDPKCLKQVAELANTAGKVIAASKIQIEYELLKKKVKDFPIIEFMES